MIVTFNPRAGSTADANAAYINFLRCVTAVMTAAAGTTSLTVNPITGITGAVDNTKNCILSIDANTEAGGWTTSASHNVPNPGSAFTAIANNSAYKADFYVNSGKSTLPYIKCTFHVQPANVYGYWSAYGSTTWSPTVSSNINMTFGASTTSDLTGTSYPRNSAANTTPTSGNQTTAFTLNDQYGISSGYYTIPSFFANNSVVNYKIAATANYVIVWESHPSNSYDTGFNNTIGAANSPASYYMSNYSYGAMMYGGLRETESWENNLNYNPPWVAAHIQHVTLRNTTASADTSTACNQRNELAASLVTRTNTGVISSTAQTYVSASNTSQGTDPICTYGTPTNQGAQFSAAGNPDYCGYFSGQTASSTTVNNLLPIMNYRSKAMASNANQQSTALTYMPVVDPNTGSLVPPAVPMIIRRTKSDSWANGGAMRGIYKSLSAPLNTMKLYWTSANQTFTINGEPYMPVVFNEDMYLVRKA